MSHGGPQLTKYFFPDLFILGQLGNLLLLELASLIFAVKTFAYYILYVTVSYLHE